MILLMHFSGECHDMTVGHTPNGVPVWVEYRSLLNGGEFVRRQVRPYSLVARILERAVMSNINLGYVLTGL